MKKVLILSEVPERAAIRIFCVTDLLSARGKRAMRWKKFVWRIRKSDIAMPATIAATTAACAR